MLTYLAQCQCVKPPVYALFICFLIRVLHLELSIAKKNCYHCKATKFDTYRIMHTIMFLFFSTSSLLPSLVPQITRRELQSEGRGLCGNNRGPYTCTSWSYVQGLTIICPPTYIGIGKSKCCGADRSTDLNWYF